MPEFTAISRFSPWPVEATLARLLAVAGARGLSVYATVNHHGQAIAQQPDPHEATTVLLGRPLASSAERGTPPLAALRSPVVVLVWSDAGQTTLSYVSWPEIAACWWIPACESHRAWNIEAIVNAVINR